MSYFTHQLQNIQRAFSQDSNSPVITSVSKPLSTLKYVHPKAAAFTASEYGIIENLLSVTTKDNRGFFFRYYLQDPADHLRLILGNESSEELPESLTLYFQGHPPSKSWESLRPSTRRWQIAESTPKIIMGVYEYLSNDLSRHTEIPPGEKIIPLYYEARQFSYRQQIIGKHADNILILDRVRGNQLIPVTAPPSLRLESILGCPISDLHLDTRTTRSLEKAGVTLIGDLVQKSDDDLLQISRIGRKALRLIKDSLHSIGLRLCLTLPLNWKTL